MAKPARTSLMRISSQNARQISSFIIANLAIAGCHGRRYCNIQTRIAEPLPRLECQNLGANESFSLQATCESTDRAYIPMERRSSLRMPRGNASLARPRGTRRSTKRAKSPFDIERYKRHNAPAIQFTETVSAFCHREVFFRDLPGLPAANANSGFRRGDYPAEPRPHIALPEGCFLKG